MGRLLYSKLVGTPCTCLFKGIFLHFQLQRSDDRTIVLRDLHVDMTGKYTCEVSTEGIFETVKDMAKMTVIGKLINH